MESRTTPMGARKKFAISDIHREEEELQQALWHYDHTMEGERSQRTDIVRKDDKIDNAWRYTWIRKKRKIMHGFIHSA